MLRREPRVDYFKRQMHGRVLDAGAVSNTLHFKLQQETGCQVFGLDIQRPARPIPLFVTADAQALPFGEGVFDTIIAGEMIEHLPDPQAFLRCAYRVLRNDGHLLISTPNVKSYVNRTVRASFHSEHISLMDASTLLRYLCAAGFTVAKFFCLPYTYEATPGVRIWFRYFFWLRWLLHHVMPQKLQEEMIVLAKKCEARAA